MSRKLERWEEHALSLIDQEAYRVKCRETDDLLSWLEVCESPIERIMGAELSFITVLGSRIEKCGTPGRFFGSNENIDRFENFQDFKIEVWPQKKIGDYRADFVLFARLEDTGSLDRDLIRIVIECDGHDFHERTKEQAAHDKRRDRFMQRAGYKVFRFTGSEIHRSPEKCRDEIESFLEGLAMAGYEAA